MYSDIEYQSCFPPAVHQMCLICPSFIVFECPTQTHTWTTPLVFPPSPVFPRPGPQF